MSWFKSRPFYVYVLGGVQIKPVHTNRCMKDNAERSRRWLAVWNWKAAAVSAAVRATVFLGTNLRAGRQQALRAALVEAGFSVIAAGLLGAATERLRFARPVWAVALVVWLGLPSAMVAAQAGVHHWAGTPHLRAGLIASFVFAALASGFNWFAQRRGVLLTGSKGVSFGEDMRALPGVLLAFARAPRGRRGVR